MNADVTPMNADVTPMNADVTPMNADNFESFTRVFAHRSVSGRDQP